MSFVPVAGLYGNEGIVPVRLLMPKSERPLLEQLQAYPTLLLLGPELGLDHQQAMELLCLLGALLALGAVLLRPLRNSVVFLCLWALYFSFFQVGLFTLWDIRVSSGTDVGYVTERCGCTEWS